MAVSPLNTLERGYSVLTRPTPFASGTPGAITSIDQTAPGAELRALLHDGTLELTVTAIDNHPPLQPVDLD